MEEDILTQQEKEQRIKDLSSLINSYLDESEKLIDKKIAPKLDGVKRLLDMANELDYFPKEIYQELGSKYNGLLLKVNYPSFGKVVGSIGKILREAGISA